MNQAARILGFFLLIAPLSQAFGAANDHRPACGALAGFTQIHSAAAMNILAEFNQMPTYLNPMESIESLVSIAGKADPQLTHHKSYNEIAAKEGRIFENPDLRLLPPGTFPFVILEDNTVLFGLDDTGLEIGVKHFQLAQGRKVKVAGEFDSSTDQFNVESGSYMRKLRTMNGYSQDRAIQILARLFSEMRGTNVDYTTAILIKKPKSITSQNLKKYCWQKKFAELHPVICGRAKP